jgi:beta-glucosidase
MPWAFAYFGYGIGIHAPGKANFNQFLKAAHTINLAQGESVRAIKAASPKATVGSAFSMAPGYPKLHSEADRAAPTRYNAMNNHFFLNTAMHGEYPKAFMGEARYDDGVQGRRQQTDAGTAGLDRISLLHAEDHPMRAMRKPPAERTLALRSKPMKPEHVYTQFHAVLPTEGPLRDSGLEVWPKGMYDLAMQVTRDYRRPIIEITENGCGHLDAPYEKDSGRSPDARRTDFFRQHLAELARAIADGANVRAYHAWSLLDNSEWTDGYSQRYGITYVDFRDQKRTVKDSGLWYGRAAGVNRLDVYGTRKKIRWAARTCYIRGNRKPCRPWV